MSTERKARTRGDVLLEIRDLRIAGFSDERWHEIVKGVDLVLRRGEVLGLIGESGAGKSTIGLAAMGFARPGCRISAGTIMFDGTQAQKGLALNRMCFSFNSAENRAAFVRDEDAYCRKFGLSEEQRAAVRSRSVLKMIEAGGNVYYLAKLAGIFGLNVQDIGAQQTGTSVDEFKAKLVAAAAADSKVLPLQPRAR